MLPFKANNLSIKLLGVHYETLQVGYVEMF